jgi:carboxylesterase type B
MPGSLLNAMVRGLSTTTAASSPSVSLTNGTVHGGVCSSNHGAAYFHGIPYAKAPTGDLRFAPPQAYDSKYSKGGLNATETAPSCIQFSSAGKEKGKTSEDCLYVDVWKPANATNQSELPVRVFLYGGSNLVGGISDPLYDGCNVANDAVMVSINYRLGPLGFMALESAGIAGNQGVQDIVQGLEWVQSNIAAFGGSPKKVMLHGESAGAIDAFTVATLEQAPRLMSALISESGGGRHAPLGATAQSLGKNYAQSLKCAANDAKCLRSKSTDELTSSFRGLPTLNAKKMGAVSIDSPADGRFTPFVDGKIVQNQPGEQPVRVPAIFGSNAYEGTLFARGQFSSPASATEKDYKNFLQENFGNQAKEVEEKYPLASFKATKYPAFYAISQVITDASFLCPAARALNTATSHKVDVWTYHFSTTPKCSWNPDMKESDLATLGATHSAEIPFMMNATSQLPQPGGKCEMTPSEKQIASFMSKAWTEMAASQKPASNNEWPAYGGADQSRGINFANSTGTGTVNYGACDFWNRINGMQLAQAKNGTNVTSMELPKSTTTHSRVLTTETKTEIGVYTSTTTIEKNGKKEVVAKTMTGAHAVVTTAELYANDTKKAQFTTYTTMVTGPFTVAQTTKESGREKLITRTSTGLHAVTTTAEVKKDGKHEQDKNSTSTETTTTITHAASPAHTTTQTKDGHTTTITEKSQSAFQTTVTKKENAEPTPSTIYSAPQTAGSPASDGNPAAEASAASGDGFSSSATTTPSSSAGSPKQSGQSDVLSSGASSVTSELSLLVAALAAGLVLA